MADLEIKRVLGKYVLISEISEKVQTESGLLFYGDEVSKARYRQGNVVMVGEDVSTIAPNERIFYDKGNSFPMLVHGTRYVLIREVDAVLVF